MGGVPHSEVSLHFEENVNKQCVLFSKKNKTLIMTMDARYYFLYTTNVGLHGFFSFLKNDLVLRNIFQHAMCYIIFAHFRHASPYVYT